MGLLCDLETRFEQQIPIRLPQSLQPALDDYQPLCPDCGLAMRRHHPYARTITTGYGELRRREIMGTVWTPHNLTVLLQNGAS